MPFPSPGDLPDPGIKPGSPALQEMQVQSLHQEDPLGKKMAPHFSILAWEIPQTEEPGGLQPTGSQRTGHDLATSLVAQLVKNLLRHGFSPWVGKIPWRKERLPTSVFWPGEFPGLYSPWGGKELETIAAAAALLQSCPTLCDPIDSSPPGSSVPGILQARTLEWVAIFFSNV